MARFGFGYRGARARKRGNTGQGAPSVRPGSGWTGVAGSGFASPPVDPVRTTAKPALRLLTPSNQYFTSDLLVGVIGAANANGTLLDTLGIAKVVLHYEGNVVELQKPSFETIIDANGVPRQYLGWWARLQRTGNGHANVYFEAFPRDETMQRRVIGPYQFSPQTSLHDYALEVAPTKPEQVGVRYASILGALNYLRTVAANNPLINISEAGTYDIGSMSTTYQGQGYCRITATVPVTIARTGFSSDNASLLRGRWDGLRLSGANITLDGRNISALYHESPTGRQHWLDGINVINSAGRYALWRMGTRPLGYFVRDYPWFTECDIGQISNPCVNASLVRGCRIHGGYGDVVTDAACVVGTRTEDWTSGDGWTIDVPALTVAYSGAELSASLALSGGNDTSSRSLTATWGTNQATFTVGNTEAMQTAGAYTLQQVANWLNGLGAGFTATVLDGTRRASALSLRDLKGAAFTARDVKSAPLTLVTMFDQHTDWFQQNSVGMVENCVLTGNLCTGLVAQDIFITGTGGARDFAIFNNAFDNALTTGIYDSNAFLRSQLARSHSHVVIAHNTWSSQALWFRGDQGYDPDRYCLIANNTMVDFLYQGTVDPDAVIRDNHLQAGATGGGLGTGTTVGGTQSQSFASSAQGKFSARGVLQNDRRAALLTFDRTGRSRGTVDVVGSEADQAITVVEPAAPAHGCVQFPSCNRQYDGIGASIAYPNTNLVQTPLLRYNSAGAFFVMLQVPHERTKRNREYRVIGGGVGTSSSMFSFVHYGDNYFEGERHDEFRWRSRGNTGDTLDLSVDVQTRADRWQLLVVRADGSGGYSIASYAAGEPKIAGSTQSSLTHSLSVLSGTHITVGDGVSTTGSLATLAAPFAGFDGAIAFHGFAVGTAGTDAIWQAICDGADPAAALGATMVLRLYRDYRGKDDIAQALSPLASSDSTLAGTIQGNVRAGGTAGRQSVTQYLTFERIPDGYVLCPPDGEEFGHITLTGMSAGLSGALFARVLAEDGTAKVPAFAVDVVAGTMSIDLKLPAFAGWGYLELWAESDTTIVHRNNARLGCGDKISVIGQSQIDIALNAAALALSPSGTTSYASFIGDKADPADTTTSPVARFSALQRAQMFVIEPEMATVANGAVAIADRIAMHNAGKAICVIDTAIPGTSARDWVDDSNSGRQWAVDVEVAKLAGKDRVPVWQWYTAETGYDYSLVFNGVVLGTGPYAAHHTLFDGSIQNAGYKLGVCLPSRATVTTAGPFDADGLGANRTYAQSGQMAWCAANPSISAIGPATTDMAIDNIASGSPAGASPNLGGPHESQVLRDGVYRLGYRIGETYLRARGLSPCPGNPYVDPAQVTIDTSRSVITAKCVLPNGGLGLRTQDGREPTGFELSLDGGSTWTRSGFTATIINSTTVTLTKTSGAWPSGLKFSYLRGGPFSYGTSEELTAHYKGSLYDGCECEDGLGVPLLGVASGNGITL